MICVGGTAPTDHGAATMFTVTRNILTLSKVCRGVYCVGAYHPADRSIVCHYRAFGTRGEYEVGVHFEIGGEHTILGTATTLAQAEQIINNHYTSL
jgi:hypothetical protein